MLKSYANHECLSFRNTNEIIKTSNQIRQHSNMSTHIQSKKNIEEKHSMSNFKELLSSIKPKKSKPNINDNRSIFSGSIIRPNLKFNQTLTTRNKKLNSWMSQNTFQSPEAKKKYTKQTQYSGIKMNPILKQTSMSRQSPRSRFSSVSDKTFQYFVQNQVMEQRLNLSKQKDHQDQNFFLVKKEAQQLQNEIGHLEKKIKNPKKSNISIQDQLGLVDITQSSRQNSLFDIFKIKYYTLSNKKDTFHL